MKNHKLRKAILTTVGSFALIAASNHALAISPSTLPILTAGQTDATSGTLGKRTFSDYGTNLNYGWTHKAGFAIFQVGSGADIAAGTSFNVNVDLKANGSTQPMNNPAFSIWTSGTTPLVAGAANGAGYGHSWSQVRGAFDGGVADDPCGNGGDCALGSNGWLGTGGGGNLVNGHNGWIGYANAGYSFTNGDGDKIQGLFAGASNLSNVGQYGGGASDPLNGSSITNVNSTSPFVNGGSATLALGDANLTLLGLKAGYYLIGFGGACPDVNANGQSCATAPVLKDYTLSISNNGVSAVPVPGAVWLFGSAILGFGTFGRRKEK